MTDPQEPSAASSRQDSLPAWVVVALLIFASLRIYDVMIVPARAGHSAARQAKVADTDLDTTSLGDLITADVMAKSGFVLSTGIPNTQLLDQALTSAEDLEDETHNAPAGARRVMVLRSLLGKPPLAKTPKGLLPLDAFGAALGPNLPPADRARYVHEGALWADLYGAKPPSKTRAVEIARDLPRLTNIRWWAQPALSTLYTRVGDQPGAERASAKARDRATPSLAGALTIYLLRIAMILAGIVLFVVLIASAISRRLPASPPVTYGPYPPEYPGGPPVYVETVAPAKAGFNLWPTQPESIAESDRRLGAGDLFGVFVIFLVAREIIGVILTGFSGFGAAHTLSFSGAISPFMHRLMNLSPSNRVTVVIGMEAVIYVISAIPPFLWLRHLARSRGASLSKELGIGRRLSGKGFIYGIGGYCISQPIVLAVGLIAPWVFRHMPEPANPAIPQLVSANGILAGAMMLMLVSIAAPIVEEVLFRGVLYQAIRMRTGVWPAILISGFVFGFVHPVGIAEMFPLAMLGCVFAWMAETRRSLGPSMVAHCVNNASSAILLLALMQS